jgi:hypothetical protein
VLIPERDTFKGGGWRRPKDCEWLGPNEEEVEGMNTKDEEGELGMLLKL